MGVVDGSIAFDELKDFTVTTTLLFLLGLCICCAGVLLLVTKRPPSKDEAGEGARTSLVELGKVCFAGQQGCCTSLLTTTFLPRMIVVFF